MKCHYLLKPILFVLVSFFVWRCEWDGYKPQVTTVEDFNETHTENKELNRWDIDDIAVLYDIGENLRNDIGLWGYETGVEWIEGVEYRDSSNLEVTVFKERDRITIKIEANLSNYETFPETWNSDFGHKDEADHLQFDLTIRNNKNNRKIRFSEDDGVSSSGKAKCEFVIYPETLAKISTGMIAFDLKLQTEFVSFFGYKSGVKPLKSRLKMDFYNPQFYHTKFYFKSITLNEEVTDAHLGTDNDWNDSRPETSMAVRYEDQYLFFGHSQNSYSYRGSESADIFHLDTNIMLDLNAVDLDYGFNGNDNICDTLISIRDLEGKEYHSLKMKCVEELLVRTEFKGPAN